MHKYRTNPTSAHSRKWPVLLTSAKVMQVNEEMTNCLRPKETKETQQTMECVLSDILLLLRTLWEQVVKLQWHLWA